jgi:hypothetical protein
MSFNGTAGMWRREALEDAGGWSADTLTEDLDLSYRAQMTGWRFVFRPQVGVPAEIPETVRGLEVQQKRWSQGGVQTGRKVLPALLAGPWSPVIKWEAVAHLFGHVAHPLTLVLGVLLVPSALARQALGLEGLLVLDILVFLCATTSFLLFYCMAGRRRSRRWRSLLPVALLTMALGIGLTASVSRAVVRGLWRGAGDPFHRTPKRGDGGTWYSSPSGRGDLGLKLGLTVWMCASLVVAVTSGLFATVPFVVLFGAGYAWLALGELREALETRRRSREGAPARTARGREPLIAS